MTLRVPEPVDRNREGLSAARQEKHADGVHSLADAIQLVHGAVRVRWGMEGNRFRGLPWVYAWAVDVGPDWVVFRIEMPGTTKLMLASYELIGDEVTFGEAVEVRRYSLYEPVDADLGDGGPADSA